MNDKKIKNKHGIIFRSLMKALKLFKRKPKIYNLNDEKLKNNAIYISNHSAASGPLTISLYFPVFFIPWGTYEMTGNYKTRWNYLYHIFYRKKIGYGKFKSFLLATSFGIISKMLYKGMKLIPTYPDYRLRNTINSSLNYLENDLSILIFPEDSNSGYHDILESYNSGFVYLNERYYKRNKKYLPIYPIYYSKKDNAMIVGKKRSLDEFEFNNLNKDEIAEKFKDITNNLRLKLYTLLKKKRI